MKHFYAHMSGDQKNDVSVSASKNGSIQAHIRSFNHGVFISMSHYKGVDTFNIYLTKGTLGERSGEPMELIKSIEVPSF